MHTLSVDPNARALIFDLDGTLAHTMPLHYFAWKEMFAQHGVDYPENLFYELAGVPACDIVPIVNERLGVHVNPVGFDEAKDDMFRENMHLIQPIELVISIARENAGKLPMAIGSGGVKDIVFRTLDILHIRPLFAAVVTSEDVSRHKPEPDTFLRCAELLGVEPKFCQVFEDADLGLEAARRAGMIATDVRKYL